MSSKLDIMKFFSQYEDDIDFADFSPDELEEMMREFCGRENSPMSAEELKEKYFEFTTI